MQSINKYIKTYLAKNLDKWQRQANNTCPTDNLLMDYISDSLSPDEMENAEKHISNCKNCLEKISLALKADALFKKDKLAPARQGVVCKAEQIASKNSGFPANRRRKKRNLWFLAAIIAFSLSFIIPKYFLQCLTASILLGIKWIIESENMRTLILVLDSWRKRQNDHDEEILRRINKRNDTNMFK